MPRDLLELLEAVHRRWGPLAYGPGVENSTSGEPPSDAREPIGAAVEGEWAAGIVSTIRRLTDPEVAKPSLSILEIGTHRVTMTPYLRAAYPHSKVRVTCPNAGSCPIHRFEGDERVRVFDVDERQIFSTDPGKDRRLFEVVVCLEPEIVSPVERAEGSDHYLPEMAVRWLSTYAGYYFVAVHESSSLLSTADGENVRRVAAGPGDLVVLCVGARDDISRDA